jgi:predicted transcriptional regulator
VTEDNKLRDLVAQVAASYFSNTHVNPSDIKTVVNEIAASLIAVKETATDESAPAEPEQQKLTSAQIRKSITPAALISFEDGKSYKTLKRHLGLKGLTPADYRAKWGLPKDYPMVSPGYSAQRSALAKSLGLGQKGRTASAKPVGRKRAASKS